jgi:hypothetical protein
MVMDLVSVAPGGNRLPTPDGKPFFAVIVNYVGHSDRAWGQFMPALFDPALIESDFRPAQVTAIRAADQGRLISVGWDDPALASLPGNPQTNCISGLRSKVR